MTLFQPDSTPIFGREGRSYHYFASCVSARRDGDSMIFQGALESGKELSFVVSVVAQNIIRVRYNVEGGAVEHETPYTTESVKFEPASFQVDEDDESFLIDTGAVIVRVNKEPWQVSVSDRKGGVLFQQEIWDKGFVIPITYPAGYSEGSDGEIAVHENISLEPDEHLFGLGPKYMSVNKRGKRSVMWCSETVGTNTTDLSYMSVPFFMSSRGYGLFLNHGAKSIFELGSYSTVAASIRVDSPLMDYYLIFGKRPTDILLGYLMLTGFPPIPPKWAFGLWMSRCWYFDRKTIEEVVERMHSLGIPLDVINIDPAWLKDWPNRRQAACEFEWNEKDFPDPEGFLRELREKNVRVCLWENPYVPPGCDFYEEGKREEYLVKNTDGEIAEPTHPMLSGMGIIDYTNPKAVEWVKQAHRRLLRQGVAAFKTDYGENIPEDAVFHNGMTGREMHNFYPLLYNKAVYEVIKEVHGEAMVYGRSGGAGSQRYPTQWAADSQCNFSGMAGALKGGLSYALSGGAFWGHDIGGFVNPKNDEPPTPTLYIRWAQFGLLSPIARFHGRGPREPWEFGDEAVEIVRKFALLRSRLVPYLYSYARQASLTGLPLMRPIYLEFPDDPHAPYEELEYLLGRDLLIAPVFSESGKRTVYLPPGRWTDFWSGEPHDGPTFLKLNVPLDTMPIYIREDSIVPLGREMQYVEEYPWDVFQLEVCLEKQATFSLYDGEEVVTFDATKKGESIELKISPSNKTYHIVLHGAENIKEVESEWAVSDLSWRTFAGETTISLKTAGPATLRILTS